MNISSGAGDKAWPAEAAVTAPGVGGVFLAGDAAHVEIKDGVVYDAPIAGAKFNRRHEFFFVGARRNYEIAKHVAAVRGDFERLRHFDDQV